MTKRGAVTSVIIWSFVAVFLLGVMIMGIYAGSNGSSLFGRGSPQEIYSCVKNADEFSSVEISWRTGSVNITPSEDDQMRLTQTSRYSVSELECTLSGGCLSIKQKSDWGFFFIGFGTMPSDLTLSLPQKQYEKFSMNMTSGDTSLRGVAATTMKLHVTSGKMEADSLKAGDLTATVTSGKIAVGTATADSLSVDVTSGKIDFEGSFKAITANTTSGKVSVASDTVPLTLNTDVTSGKISISIPDNDGFTLSLKKTSGSFHTDFDLMTSINGSTNSYTYLTGSATGRQYAVKVTSGTFELLKTK